jgi:hypothetical protein
MLRGLGRIVLVPLAMLLAAASALGMLFTLGLERVTRALHGRDVDMAELTTLWEALSAGSNLLTVASLVPALLVVAIGEIGRIRAFLYYVVGGGIAMAALPLVARGNLDGGLAQLGIVWQVFATAGFVGGVVYWLVAGRSA